MRRPLVYSLGALLLTSLGLASAQNAYTSRPMNVRAGPNREYPLVAQVDAGAPLDVHGCLNDWSWCDVSFDDNRGWIYAGGVSFVYQGGRVPLYSYGPNLGLPVLTFSLMTYWGDYYRGRPWYGQRDTWSHRTLPPHTRPAGRPHAGPPPAPQPRPAAGRHPQPQGTERRRTAPQGAERGRAAPQERPQGESPSMTHGRPPSGGAPERGGQTGHAAPAARGSHAQQKRPPPDHPPQGI